uniref:(California timema) hypothetical protein n=1 Tax=Timema californicum TaxID=61474 RepID=A0A7R9PCN4_TIMCA|nr:unnamed protein product [Timema californicum]
MYSSPMASLVLTDSSQLTSDSQHLGPTINLESNLDLPVISSLVYCESCTLDHADTEAGYTLPDTPIGKDEAEEDIATRSVNVKELKRVHLPITILHGVGSLRREGRLRSARMDSQNPKHKAKKKH